MSTANHISTKELVRQERETLGAEPGDELIGLSLSGGGIRSATFNLGLLQGLHRVGLLPAFHYLSTVSGGGYIGGFWTAWRHHNPEGDLFPEETDEGETEPRPIRHLREFSNFLSPRLGLLSADTGRLVVAAVSAVAPALIVTVSLLVLVVAAAAATYAGTARLAAFESALVLAAVTAALFAAMEWRLSVREKRHTTDDGGAAKPSAEPWPAASHAVAALLTAIAVGVVWYRFIHPGVSGAEFQALAPAVSLPAGRSLFAPALAWLLPAAAIVVLRALTSRLMTSFRALQTRAAFDRVVARLFLLAGLWAAFALIWLAASHLVTVGVAWLAAYGASTAASVAVFAWLRKVLDATVRAGSIPATLRERLTPMLPAIVAWLAVLLLVLGAATLVVAAGRLDLPGSPGFLIVPALAINLVALFVLDPNRVGLHAFYRGRISRAFLGASNPRAGYPERRTTEEVRDDDMSLSRLDGRRGPIHLVCATANELAPLDPLVNLQRGGCSAVLSPLGFSVDEAARRWRVDESESPTLGAALTASAAAFNSMMGSYSQRFGPAASFLMTALNLRLGRWIRHPHTQRNAKKWWFSGWLFYKELLGLSRTDGADVHLSDGGHFENMGLYELLRRRCRYIVASDCGADPNVAFGDVANLMRRAREDFDVEIQLDLSALAPDEQGRSRQSAVAGDILYPGGRRGVLLLIKPALTGAEPADVTQYRTANPDFPHESTLDQFYDGAQWESYRRLGQHTVETAFAFAKDQAPWWPDVPRRVKAAEARRHASTLFARARMKWLPGLPDAVDRHARVGAAVGRLDELLREAAPAPLLAQVWKEVGEARQGLAELLGADGDGAPLAGARATGHAGAGAGPPDGEGGRALVAQEAGPKAPGGGTVQSAGTAIATGDGGGDAGEAADRAAASLHACRHALVVMEDAYRTLELERRHAHPANLGIMNLAGRWAVAPVFRFWWPLLRTLHAPGFVRFLEARFGGAGEGPVGGRYDERTGADVVAGKRFASTSWRAARGQPDPGDRFLAYELALPLPGGGAPVGVEAALLRFREEADDDDGATLTWQPDDFFVPPGLWGIGLGRAFLAALRARPPAGARRLVVDSTGDGVNLVDVTMYHEAGFRPVTAADDDDRVDRWVLELAR